MKGFGFWDLVTPCSLLKVNLRSGETCSLHLLGRSVQLAACFMVASCLAYSSAVNMETTCSCGTSGDFQLTARSYIPEEVTLQIFMKFGVNEIYKIVSTRSNLVTIGQLRTCCAEIYMRVSSCVERRLAYDALNI
jgi:hypothetical protein